MYNYIGILNKSSAVNKAVTCNFLNNSSSKLNLVLVKGNIIEIYNITKEGLVTTPYLNVYGKIILLEKFPAGNQESNQSNFNNNISNTTSESSLQTSDNLFILTEDLDFSIISYNKVKNEIVNLDKGTVKEDIGKRQDRIHAVFDDNHEYAVISAYKNIFKIVYMRNRNKNDDFSVRYEYEDLLLLFPFNFEISSSYNQRDSNNIANKFNILKKDAKTGNIINMTNSVQYTPSTTKSSRSQSYGMIKVVNNFKQSNHDSRSVHLETFNFNIFKQEVYKDVSPGLDLTTNPTCSMIISPKAGGLIIFYSNYLKYYTITAQGKIMESETKVYSDRKFITHCQIDKFRYLVVDEFGNLFLLALKPENQDNISNSTVNSESKFTLIFQFLGEINYASTLAYLDNNYVFVGSEKANSQFIKITKYPTNQTNRPFIEVIEEYENLAPISDFCLVESTNDEVSTEILCVSGTDKSCCLKTIRKGTSINIEAEIPLNNVKSLFAVLFNNSNSMLIDEQINKNVLMFVNYMDRTSLISFDSSSYSISHYYSDNILLSEPSIYASNFVHNEKNYILQITSSFICIYDDSLGSCIRVPNVITPTIVKMKKRKGFLYIYNKNNLLIRYSLFEILSSGNSTDSEFIPEILSDDILISAFSVSDDMIVYSEWHLNKIFVHSLKTKKTELLCEFDSNVFCPSISFLKNDGIKFLFIALSNGRLLYYKLKTTIAKNLPSYTYSSDDFVLMRKYNISNETFEIKKVKSNNKNYLFLSTDLPALLFINKENPNISNFNVKECRDLVNLNMPFGNLSAFLFKDFISIGNLSNSQSQNIITKHIGKSIYNLTNVTLPSTNGNINLIAFTIEEKREDRISFFSFVIMDKHFNEISRYTFENENEVCTTFVELSECLQDLNGENSSHTKLFALGTGLMESQLEEPELGHIYLIQMDENFKLQKFGELETKGAVYKIASKNNLLFVGSCSTLYVYSVTIPNNNTKQYELKQLRKSNDFTVINDIYCHDDFILVSDIFKSITVFKFDEEKEKLIECCRDYNPVWCYSLAQVDKNIYTVSDIDGNVFSLRRELHPRSDEEKYKLERVAQINFGERINKMTNVNKRINTKDWDNIFGNTESSHVSILQSKAFIGTRASCEIVNTNSINVTYFGTLEGSFGIFASIPKDTFDFLCALQTEILKVVSSTGNFEYEKWRAFKDGFISDFSKGFVEGSILQEFLNFDNNYRIDFLKKLKYPWQRNINDTINLIESLLKLH